MSKPNPAPETINQIVSLAQAGNPPSLICQALGIEEPDLNEWLEAGQAKKTKALTEFTAAYRKGVALYQIDLRDKLRKHAASDANAAFKLIELQAKDREIPREGSKPLDNQHHEAFAQLVATGMKSGPALQKVSGCKPASARANAVRLIANNSIRSRIAALKVVSAQCRSLTKERRLEIAHEVAESSTASHIDRLRAIKLDAELKGELIGRQELSNPDGTLLPAALAPIIIMAPKLGGRRSGE